MSRRLNKITTSVARTLRRFKLGAYVVDALSNPEIRRRLWITLLVVVIYRLLAAVPLPGVDMAVYQQQFASRSASEISYFLTIFTGGLLDSPSIVGLGIGVYITASIIVQMLSSVIPKLEELSKDGARGKQILDQYTRYLTVPLSIAYSLGYIYLLSQQNLGDATNPQYLIPANITGTRLLFMAIVLTAGSLLVMWLAELVTENGIGNGASLIIMVGILSSVPALLQSDLSSLDLGSILNQIQQGNWEALRDPALTGLMLLIIGSLILVAGIILITESTRKIPIQYARRERTGGNTVESYLPLKLNQSGVLPIIFASAFLTTPQLILPLLSRVVDSASPTGQFITNLQTSFLFDSTRSEYNVLYFVLIVVFSLFYAFIALRPADVAENLQKNGGFIPGIRPGNSTETYITNVMLRLTLVGALFLGGIAMIPLWFGNIMAGLTGQQFIIFSAVGGTSILIVVGVILETVRQIQSYRNTQNYERYV